MQIYEELTIFLPEEVNFASETRSRDTTHHLTLIDFLLSSPLRLYLIPPSLLHSCFL
jgi:hypothetical protein